MKETTVTGYTNALGGNGKNFTFTRSLKRCLFIMKMQISSGTLMRISYSLAQSLVLRTIAAWQTDTFSPCDEKGVSIWLFNSQVLCVHQFVLKFGEKWNLLECLLQISVTNKTMKVVTLWPWNWPRGPTLKAQSEEGGKAKVKQSENNWALNCPSIESGGIKRWLTGLRMRVRIRDSEEIWPWVKHL